MQRMSTVITAALAVLLLGASAPAFANDAPPAETGTGEALLDALTRVPFTSAALGSTVSYLDQAALQAARPGASRPERLVDALTAVEADDPAADLWLAALMGAASGDMGLLRRLPQAAEWPERMGFDLLDVDRHVTFGLPPSDGSVLIGRFDPAVIRFVHESRGYEASEAGSRTRLCGAAGCDQGMRSDLANADPGLPFGGEIGRSEPLSVSDTDMLVSADLATLEGMEAAADGRAASLAEDPAYRGLALAGDPAVTLTQATFLPGGMLGLGPDVYQLLTRSPEEAAELLESLADDFEAMPAPAGVVILDGATADEQVVTIGLAYEDEADAAVAADVLPRRLESLAVPSYGAQLSSLLAERGVSSVVGSVVPAGAGTLSVARVEIRAPLPGVDADTGRPAPSSSLYRLLVELVNRRDLLWLVPVLPLE